MQRIQHISIPKPCHEQWQNMTPDTAGRHCNSCAKTVVDFTMMSNQQIIDYFNAGNQTCGRFDAQQIGQINRSLNIEDTGKISRWKSWLLAGTFLGSLPFAKVYAQIKPAQVQNDSTGNHARQGIANEKPVGMLPGTRIIKGRITDEDNNEGLPGATIRIHGTSIASSTDYQGNFKIEIPQKNTVIDVVYIGYQTKSILLDAEASSNLSIKLKVTAMMLGEPVISVKKAALHKRLFYRYIKKPLRKIWASDSSF